MRIENEQQILEENYPGIVPFLMEEYKGNLSLEVYSGIENEAKAFLARFEGRYFSKEALSFIARATDSYLLEKGYRRDTVGETLYYYQYEMTGADTPESSLILPNTQRLTAALLKKIKRNLTTFSLGELLQKRLPTFVTVEEGTVVALATVNERLQKGAYLEITVETAPAYRRRGYAVSNVAALSAYLLSKGATVAYCCRNTHTKSNKVARRVGFHRVGRFYAVSAYRINVQDKE